MDRRQQRSREAIFNAFTALLEKKHFSAITVQEIIDAANVGRTTFYAHFDTKDVLLREMCAEIFDHIFSHALRPEGSHDFSASGQNGAAALVHLVYHLRDDRGHILTLLTGDSSELFMSYFREMLERVFRDLPDRVPAGLPEDFALDHVVVSFAGAVKWWVRTGMRESPEELVDMFLKVTGSIS